jgi:hypothetical protein
MISQLIKEAKAVKGYLKVMWLDLANAHPGKDHQDFSRFKIIASSLEGIHLRFTVQDYMTSWQRVEKGIVTDCTISVVLFVMAMNLLIKAGKREARRPKTRRKI